MKNVDLIEKLLELPADADIVIALPGENNKTPSGTVDIRIDHYDVSGVHQVRNHAAEILCLQPVPDPRSDKHISGLAALEDKAT
jgi:hypothetical protein